MLQEGDQAKPQVEGRHPAAVFSPRDSGQKGHNPQDLVSRPSFRPLKDPDQKQAARSGS